MKKILATLALLALTSAPVLAADNPWVGTWKLDPAKSQFTGDTFTYSKTPKGMMHYSDGSTFSWDFGIDGKEYKTAEGRTTTWTANSATEWTSITKLNGTVLSTDHYTLSPDGKTLSITYAGIKPDGSKFNDSATYTRVTGTNGLPGKWRSTKVNVSAPDSFIIAAKPNGIIHWDIPSYKESVEGKTDGSDLPITGPVVAPGTTLAVKMTTPRKISYTVKENGKIVALGIQTLAADGKSFTDVSWSPGKMSEKATGYYAKQ